MAASMLAYAILASGFCLLALGGETSLRGLIGLSRALSLPPLFTALVVVSVGGSLPLLFLVLQAASQGADDIAVASVVGRNIFNMLFTMGVAAIVRSVPGPPKVVFRDGGALLLASLAVLLVCEAGVATRQTGVFLLAGCLAYLALSLVTDWRRPLAPSFSDSSVNPGRQPPSAVFGGILLLLGLVCLYFGGLFTLDSFIAVARIAAVPRVVLGLTLAAVVTGLPALLNASFASARGAANSVGSQLIVGSVLNIVFVLGIVAFLFPLRVPAEVARMDCYVAAAGAGVVVTMMLPGWRIGRAQGLMLLVGYLGYLALLAWRQGFLTL